MRSSRIRLTCARYLNRQLLTRKIKKSKTKRGKTHCVRISVSFGDRWRRDRKVLLIDRLVL